MELISIGPVLFIDTAGLDDKSEVGKLRIKKTKEMMKRTDFALYLMDVNNIDAVSYTHLDVYKRQLLRGRFRYNGNKLI